MRYRTWMPGLPAACNLALAGVCAIRPGRYTAPVPGQTPQRSREWSTVTLSTSMGLTGDRVAPGHDAESRTCKRPARREEDVMCNLYSSTTPQKSMRDLFQVSHSNDMLGNAEPMPSVFPGTAAPVVRLTENGVRELVPSRFGFVLPQRSKRTGEPIQPKFVANARQDKLRSSPFWRESFVERRCLVPASAFCEMKGRRPATYFWFGVTGDSGSMPFAFAGLWKTFRGLYRGEQTSFSTHTIVTTTPNRLVATVHPTRMPVILDPESYQTWLFGACEDVIPLTRPYDADKMLVLTSGVGMRSFDPELPFGT